jgi:hypothetical protein
MFIFYFNVRYLVVCSRVKRHVSFSLASLSLSTHLSSSPHLISLIPLYPPILPAFQVKDYMEGATVVWWSVSSTTSSLGVLQCPEFLGDEGQRMMFTIEARHAVDIRRYSAIPDESEVC